jgi:hypothetical protein
MASLKISTVFTVAPLYVGSVAQGFPKDRPNFVDQANTDPRNIRKGGTAKGQHGNYWRHCNNDYLRACDPETIECSTPQDCNPGYHLEKRRHGPGSDHHDDGRNNDDGSDHRNDHENDRENDRESGQGDHRENNDENGHTDPGPERPERPESARPFENPLSSHSSSPTDSAAQQSDSQVPESMDVQSRGGTTTQVPEFTDSAVSSSTELSASESTNFSTTTSQLPDGPSSAVSSRLWIAIGLVLGSVLFSTSFVYSF